jgi:hypothetical protein
MLPNADLASEARPACSPNDENRDPIEITLNMPGTLEVPGMFARTLLSYRSVQQTWRWRDLHHMGWPLGPLV